MVWVRYRRHSFPGDPFPAEGVGYIGKYLRLRGSEAKRDDEDGARATARVAGRHSRLACVGQQNYAGRFTRVRRSRWVRRSRRSLAASLACAGRRSQDPPLIAECAGRRSRCYMGSSIAGPDVESGGETRSRTRSRLLERR